MNYNASLERTIEGVGATNAGAGRDGQRLGCSRLQHLDSLKAHDLRISKTSLCASDCIDFRIWGAAHVVGEMEEEIGAEGEPSLQLFPSC